MLPTNKDMSLHTALPFYLIITSNKPPVCYLKMCPQSTTVMYYIW